jgi:fructokinase
MMFDASRIRVAVAGEALIDLIGRPDGTYEPCLGGAVYNLSRALGRQAVPTVYLNPFSSDRFGQALASQIRADGVQLQCLDPVSTVTSLAVVTVGEQGHPDYAFYREGVADRQVDAQGMVAACAALPALTLVCTGCLALDPRDAAHYLPWLSAQRAAGRCVVVDANLRPSVMPDGAAYRAHVLHVLTQADVIKVSDEDLEHLQVPGNTALERAQGLLQATSARLLALTMGPQGGWLLARNGASWYAREATSLEVVDTVGAGDSFLAGMLTALLYAAQGIEPTHFVAWLDRLTAQQGQAVLRHALASASWCVQNRGCVPPTWEEANHWALSQPVVQSTTKASAA